MKEGSAAEHIAAEQSPFMSELLASRITARGYCEYLLRLRVVYAALEDAMRSHRTDPMVAAVYGPALERLTAIDADLEHWAPGAAREVESPAAAGLQPASHPHEGEVSEIARVVVGIRSSRRGPCVLQIPDAA
jgi:heme oxygenase